jgi:hypothetical protein
MWGESVVHAVGGNYASWGSDGGAGGARAAQHGASWARMAKPAVKLPKASPQMRRIEANQSAQTEFCVRELAVGVLESDITGDGGRLSDRGAGVCALES